MIYDKWSNNHLIKEINESMCLCLNVINDHICKSWFDCFYNKSESKALLKIHIIPFHIKIL